MAEMTFELERCPHCGSGAQVREHAVYRYQCMACGNPRIPLDERWLSTSRPVAERLRWVRRHQVVARLWNTASAVLAVAGAATGLLGAGAAWSLDYAAAGWSFVAVVTSVPLLLAAWARLTAGKRGARASAELEAAWRQTATEFYAHAPTPRSVDDFKAAFGVDAESAFRLLGEAEVAQYLSNETPMADPAAEAELSTDAAGSARWRVIEQPGGPASRGTGDDDLDDLAPDDVRDLASKHNS